MSNLTYLNLEGCNKLEDLRLPGVASLTELHLEETGLKELPANICQLTQLTKLEIGSEFLTTLPTSIGKLSALTTLPTSIGNLSALTTLTIKGCKKLKSLPDSLKHLNLTELHLIENGLKELPANIFQLTMLTKLEIENEFLTTLPTSVGNLSPLTTLTIKECKKLKSYRILWSILIS
ncbi:hypothetical protein SUGI_0595350 [Cryptomeria japonica]|nr:hypothetical protein SUGI_0595350 [Cryptomeria japonica]